MSQAPLQKAIAVSDWALLGLLSILWGGSFLFVGVAVREVPPLAIVALRVLLAALALQLVLRAAGMRLPRERRAWAAFFGMGILNNAVPFTLIAWSQTHIASGLASILNATTPLFIVIVAHYFTRDERLTGPRLGGAVVGFIGVAVMVGGAALSALGTNVLAQLAVLGAALSYAVSGVFGRRFKALGIPPLMAAAGQVTASTCILLPMSLAVDRPWTLPMPSLGAVLSLLALALASTAFAYLIFFRLLARAGATNAGLVTFLIPVSAILFGVLILGETLEVRHIAGMALIAAGLMLIDGRPLAAVAGAFSAKEAAPRGNG